MTFDDPADPDRSLGFPAPGGAPQAAPADASEKRSRRSTRRKGRAAVRIFTVLALLASGASAGWWLRDALDDDPEVIEPTAVAVVRPVTVLDGDETVQQLLAPSVEGLPVEQATAAFVDAGADPATITVTEVPAAGESGLIVDQQPAPAAGLGDAVTLYVASAATMPDLTGQDGTAARAALADVGARGVIETEYQDGATEGLVLRTFPAAGEAVPYEVKLFTAEPPSSVAATELRWVDSSCSTPNQVVVNGVTLKASIWCVPSQDEVEYAEYALNREVSRFEATIGQEDRGVTTATIRFRVLLDDVVVGEWSIPFGTSQPISVDVKGHLRIRLETLRDNLTDESLDARAVWGEPHFVGSADAVDQLVENS